MAKQGKSLPARRSRPALDDALLIRSAESLGRMIGTLQRQLDGVSKRLYQSRDGHDGNSMAPFGLDGAGNGRRGARTMNTTSKDGTAKTKGGSRSGATKVRSSGKRTSKRASKSAVAKKSAGRGRSGAARKSARNGGSS